MTALADEVKDSEDTKEKGAKKKQQSGRQKADEHPQNYIIAWSLVRSFVQLHQTG